MKRFLALCFSLVIGLMSVHADEGMWLLELMKQQHLEDSLRRAGLQLPPSALYSETSPSLRECVGIFGGGCTGEIVSADGLVLTNHHCGFSYVHEMSSVAHDYMKNGYFAKSRAEELRTPESLTFTFVLAVKDVTDEVNAAAHKQKADEYTAMSQSFLEPLSAKLLKKSAYSKKKGMRARIVPFFGGNQFYVFFEQTYLDVRLVVNPPHNIAQFGGNSDNWIWPRQNADFAMFRIYADKNGQPAAYSKDNVPLKCRKFLPISLKGMKEGDFTMIMGFPGSTSRYLTASEVQLRTQSQNQPIVIAGNPLLDYYKKLMDESDSLRLMLEDTYFSYGNAVKNFGGMNEAVERIKLVDLKKQEENRFRTFATQSADRSYGHVIERIDTLCHSYQDSLFDARLGWIYNLQQAYAPYKAVDQLASALHGGNAKAVQSAKEELRDKVTFMPKRKVEIERGLMKLLVPYYLKYNKLGLKPDCLSQNPSAVIDSIYDASIYLDSLRFNQAVEHGDVAALRNDPLYRFCKQSGAALAPLNAAQKNYSRRRAALDKIYVRGLCEMYDWSKAPDANFTLRMTYGHVQDLKPRDAVSYDWRTVLDGMFEKESKTESDYFVNDTLRRFFERNDYGRYAREDGKLPTCFLSNNDITGGNSGSPVLNAKGELIGLAFDGNIESLSSDLKYNPALQRCINVDIRYVLFIIDKFGGSHYVLDELDIR